MRHPRNGKSAKRQRAYHKHVLTKHTHTHKYTQIHEQLVGPRYFILLFESHLNSNGWWHNGEVLHFRTGSTMNVGEICAGALGGRCELIARRIVRVMHIRLGMTRQSLLAAGNRWRRGWKQFRRWQQWTMSRAIHKIRMRLVLRQKGWNERSGVWIKSLACVVLRKFAVDAWSNRTVRVLFLLQWLVISGDGNVCVFLWNGEFDAAIPFCNLHIRKRRFPPRFNNRGTWSWNPNFVSAMRGLHHRLGIRAAGWEIVVSEGFNVRTFEWKRCVESDRYVRFFNGWAYHHFWRYSEFRKFLPLRFGFPFATVGVCVWMCEYDVGRFDNLGFGSMHFTICLRCRWRPSHESWAHAFLLTI